MQRLLAADEVPLVSIVAPPGYGKSTLLKEWAACDHRAFVWVTDSRVAYELRHLVSCTRARGDRFVVVLDFAERHERAILGQAVAAALEKLPRGCTIALASRIEPSIALGRFRAHRVLDEIGVADLAMTDAEAELLLRQEGIEPSAEDLQTLVCRTEGWPAALYLAALAARKQPGMLASFSGQHHVMFEYLRDEVLDPLPSGLRSFAVRTSVVEELTGPVCDAVVEQRRSALRLGELAQVNRLLMPVDPNHQRYRWHGLVREALLAELERVEPEPRADLERRASHWYARDGDSRRAIDHAAASGDAELTGDLLSRSLLPYLTQGRNELVEGWLTALGSDRVAGYAPLALSASLSCLTAGNADAAQRWSVAAMAALKRGQAGEHARSLTAGLRLVQALTTTGSLSDMGRLAGSAAEAEPQDGQWRPFCLALEAVSMHLRGEAAAARRVLDEVIDVAANATPSLTSLCLAQSAMIAMEAKDWELATDATDRAIMMTEEWGLTRDPVMALVFAAAAASRAHQGRVDEAKFNLRRGIDLLAALGDFLPWYGAEARILLAHASLWLADVVGARTLLADASRLRRKTPEAVVFSQWFDEAWAYIDTLAETRLAGPSSLTIAELRILRFLPTHRSFREIAEQLDVSANTVKTQAHAVYRKLGAASRSEAVALAMDAGLLG